MRRLLVVAEDRALTRFVAEAMLGHGLTAPSPRGQDAWEIARAHSGLEAFLLVTRGGRPFDAIVVDQTLPDQDALSFIDRLRKSDEGRVPVFLMSERGRDQHSRRIASERYAVAGFIEKPVTAESIRDALSNLERKRRILLVESHEELAPRYRDALSGAGYLTEIIVRGRDAVDRMGRFRPDLVVSALVLEDMRGTELCVELKRGKQAGVPVMLYGNVSLLASQEITENAHRADDFVQAPFDEGVLVERVAALIGRGVAQRPARPRSHKSTPLPPLVGSKTVEGPPRELAERASGASLLTAHDEGAAEERPPPPSASPAAVGPTKRATRRVPCQISMSVRNGERVYTSKTLDISHGGIFLATDEDIAIGTVIDMTFQIPNTPRVVNAVGKVAWVGRAPDGATGRSSAGVGVKFSKIDPQDLQLIVDYVNRVARIVYSPS